MTMRVLPDRVYPPDTSLRRRLFSDVGFAHPAKCRLSLARDLVLRYTRPGDLILDPFGGVGSTLIACTLPEPRDVVLVELEAKFCAMAAQSWAYLQGWWTGQLAPGPLGRAWIVQADSRHLPLRSADVTLASPPYADSGFASHDDFYTRGEDPSGQAHNGRFRGGSLLRDGYGHAANLGNLPHGDVSTVLGSPPYADVADRNRSQEGYSLRLDPVLRHEYGHAGGSRHIDGYGDAAGQIGSLPRGDIDSIVGSPPYARGITQGGETGAWQDKYGYQGENAGYSRGEQDLGNLPAGDVAAALGSPPYQDAREGSPRTQSTVPDDQALGTSQRALAAREPYGEDYCSAVLAVYRECWRVVRPGGLLVLITGNYVRSEKMVDLAADTIRLATAAGWKPIERWRAAKTTISFWRRLHLKRRPHVPVVWWEDVLVFAKGDPAWEFADLPPTTHQPVHLNGTPTPAVQQRSLWEEQT